MSKPTSALARTPWGVLGALVLLAGVEFGLKGLDGDLVRPEMATWRSARERAVREAVGCEVLGFGTSLTQVSFYPENLERDSGLEAHNLALPGGRMVYAYYNLRRALNAGARPRALVLDLHPAFLNGRPYRLQANGWTDALGMTDGIQLGATLRDEGFLASFVLARVLPSYRRRYEIRDAVRAALEGRPWSSRINNAITLRASRRNQGALVSRAPVPYSGTITQTDEQIWLGQGPFNLAEVHYLGRILDLAREYQAHVFCMLMPISPELQRRRAETGLDARFEQLLGWVETHPGVTIVDGRRSGYAIDAFHDASHLGVRGATAFNRSLANLLLKQQVDPECMRRTKRVALDDYRATLDSVLAAQPASPSEESRRR
ncbi:MAG: hypothetical protein U0794_08925 [Isosphaeraceae bacterium]